LVIDREKILNVAQRYVLKGQSEKAIKEYQKLVKASPRDIRSHLKLGDLYLKKGQNERAVEEYLRVAELYSEDDLSSRAISLYKKVLSLDPKHVEALHRIARLYLKEGLKGDARNYYQTVLKIRPNDQQALSALKDLEEVHSPKETPKRVSPGEPGLPRHRYSPEKGGEEMRELASFSTPISKDPPIEPEGASVDKDAEMQYHLGIAYKEMELYDYAISEFDLASSNSSIRFDCYIMLGGCFMDKGEVDKAITYYKMASELKGLPDQKLARLHFNLGCAYEANGMASEALAAFSLVLKLDHSVSEAHDKIRRIEKLREM
jgi:tetratricopeptide (TPR) repeat protein